MTERTGLIVFAAVLLLFVTQCPSLAEAHKAVPCTEPWETLKGFHSVVVGVDAPDPEFANSGISKDAIKSRVEGMLKSGNVDVAPYDSKDNGTKGVGYLVVRITTGAAEVKNEKVYGFNICISFYAWVFLGAQPDHLTMIPTWTNQMTIVCTKSEVAKVSSTAANLASFFATDFARANPKK